MDGKHTFEQAGIYLSEKDLQKIPADIFVFFLDTFLFHNCSCHVSSYLWLILVQVQYAMLRIR